MSIGSFDSSCRLLVTAVAGRVMLYHLSLDLQVRGRKHGCSAQKQKLGSFSFFLLSLLWPNCHIFSSAVTFFDILYHLSSLPHLEFSLIE